MKKMLPIVMPVINGRYDYAVPLSIMGQTNDYLPWMHSHFINLVFENKDDMRTLKFEESFIKSIEAFRPFLQLELVERKNVNENIIDYVIERIHNNQYLYFMINKYFVPNTYFYGKRYDPHPIFIYGYDSTERKFHVRTYNEKFIYTDTTLDFEIFHDAYTINDEDRLPNPYIRLISYCRNQQYTMDLNGVADSIAAFLHPADDQQGNSVSGINIYSLMKKHLYQIAEEQSRLKGFFEFFCRKNLHILWEHNMLMSMRIQHLMDKGIIQEHAFMERQESLTNTAQILRNLLMRYSHMQDNMIIEHMIRSIDQFIEKQEVLLTNLYQLLKSTA